MDPGGNSVARTLPIDGALLGAVLARLRRDSPAAALRWTLGDHGIAEVDACFTSSGPVWTSTARLWPGRSLSVTPAAVHCVATTGDEVTITLYATVDAAGDEPALWDLALAAVDELGEELLWHATRSGFTRHG